MQRLLTEETVLLNQKHYTHMDSLMGKRHSALGLEYWHHVRSSHVHFTATWRLLACVNTNHPHLAVRLQKSISTAIQFVMPPTRPNMPMARTTRNTPHTVEDRGGSVLKEKCVSKTIDKQHRRVHRVLGGVTCTDCCNSKSNTEVTV